MHCRIQAGAAQAQGGSTGVGAWGQAVMLRAGGRRDAQHLRFLALAPP